MKIAISGTSSSIGQAVLRECASRGIEVIFLDRTGEGKKFNLTSPIQLELGPVDAFVHLAWDWAEPYKESHRRNIENILPFLDSLKKRKIKLVLLSTESAAGIPKSNYGKLKHELEGEFTVRGGTSVRAGLLWGSELSGIVATIWKLSGIPLFCAHLKPDPCFYVSNEEEIARELVSQAVSGEASPSLVSLKSASEVKLSDVSHASQGSTLKLLHLALRVKTIIAMGDLMGKLGFKLPFRVDSLRSLLGEQPSPPDLKLLQKTTANSSQDFLRWLMQFRN